MFTRKPATGEKPSASNPAVVPPLKAQPWTPPVPPTKIDPAPLDAQKSAATPLEEGLVVIGKGTTVLGSIGDCRKLDIHGVLQGDVIADFVTIRRGGGIKGNVQTDHAEVHGVFEGTLIVHEHLEIKATGNVAGEIRYRTLAMQTGARIGGTVVCSEPEGDVLEEEEQSAKVVPVAGAHLNGMPSCGPESVARPISSPPTGDLGFPRVH